MGRKAFSGSVGPGGRRAIVGSPRILAVVPAFNEQGAIGRVIDAIRSSMPGADLVVIDDGSQDGTEAIVRGKGAEVVRLPFNMGIGTAMQTGYLYARRGGYDLVVQIDADGQHDPAEAQQLIAPILEGRADLTIGSRFLGKGSYKPTGTRRLGIAWLASLISVVIGQKMTDPTSGFRAAGPDVIRFFADEYPTDYPEPEVLLALHRAGFRLLEVPAQMAARQAGRSSITVRRSIYYLFKVTLAIAVGLFRARRPGRSDAR